jgi:TRAP-type mannitol/chloroaromatic compound transport system substrate-binding protein
MQRRSFLKKASLGAVAGSAVVAAPVFAQDAPTLNWRLASSFPKSLDTLFGTSELFSKYLSEATNGKFSVRNFAAGEIVPPLQVLDAVQKNTVEMGHSSGYYYIGKNPALAFDTAVPFGLNSRQTNAWMYEGDGMKLTRDVYKEFNIVNFPLGNTGTQMGGWYRKEIKTVEDIKGLKMRIAGLAGEIITRLGGLPQQLPGPDIYPALEKGTIDAVEWVGPYDDEKMGFAKVAKYYYYPGWWEGGAQVALYVNDGEWAKLPKSYQSIIEAASRACNATMQARYDNLNAQALRRLLSQGTLLRAFPRAVMDACWDVSIKVFAEYSAKSPQFKTIHDNYMGYRDQVVPWFRLAEASYDQYVGAALSRQK